MLPSIAILMAYGGAYHNIDRQDCSTAEEGQDKEQLHACTTERQINFQNTFNNHSQMPTSAEQHPLIRATRTKGNDPHIGGSIKASNADHLILCCPVHRQDPAPEGHGQPLGFVFQPPHIPGAGSH